MMYKLFKNNIHQEFWWEGCYKYFFSIFFWGASELTETFEKTLEVYTHKPAMPLLVFNTVKKIYEDFAREELLSRCLGGFT